MCRAEPEHVPPDGGERLGAERERSRRVGPESEMEELPVGVTPCNRGVGADHHRDADEVVGAAAEPAERVVDDLGLVAEPETHLELAAQELEVLRPVGAREAERGRGEIRRRGACGIERSHRSAHDLGECGLGPAALWMSPHPLLPLPRTAPSCDRPRTRSSSCCRRRRRAGARSRRRPEEPVGQVGAVRGRERVVDTLGDLDLADERVRAERPDAVGRVPAQAVSAARAWYSPSISTSPRT